MNDDELSLRLRDELHERIQPPDTAPEAVHEHLRRLRTMEVVRPSERVRASAGFRQLSALAAVLAICALVGAGLLIRASQSPDAAGPFASGIEAFGRIDANTAWAAAGSHLFITRDGGKTWSTGTIPGGRSLAQVQAALPEPAIAADPTPCVPQNSAEAANGCSSQPSLSDSMYNRFYPDFIDADHGWLLSWTVTGTSLSTASYTMTVWRTSDGGQSWTSAPLAGVFKGPGLIQFVDERHGWITVLRNIASPTVDVGPEPTPLPPMPADATTILASADGGATWTVASSLDHLACPSFVSPTEAWGYAKSGSASGYPDEVIHSIDGGRTWSIATLPSVEGYTRSYGWPEPPVGSADGVKLSLPAARDFPNGANVSPGMTLSVLFMRSSDGLKTWTVAYGDPIPSAGSVDARFIDYLPYIVGIARPQPIAAQVVGDNGMTTSLALTFDEGRTWQSVPAPDLAGNVAATQWTSPQDGWVLMSSNQGAYAVSGSLYGTTDGGRTWSLLLGPVPGATPANAATAGGTITPGPVALTAQIVDADRIDAETGWIVVADSSANQSVRITQDGGSTWSEPRSLPSNAILSTQFTDASHGWMLAVTPITLSDAVSATIWRTANGGLAWQSSTVRFGSVSGSSSSLFSTTALHFADAEHGVLFVDYGYADSASGNVCQQASTSDGGATWSQPRTTPCFAEIGFSDRLLGYASPADRSAILYVTSDGGESWTRGELPAGFVPDSGWPVELLHRGTDGTLRAVGLWSGGAGRASVIVSSDGGKTWTKAGDAKDLRTDVAHMVAVDDNHFVVGVYAEAGKAAPLGQRSDDGGLSWTDWNPSGLPSAPQTLTFVSPTVGWAGIGNTGLFATTDGGESWTKLVAP